MVPRGLACTPHTCKGVILHDTVTPFVRSRLAGATGAWIPAFKNKQGCTVTGFQTKLSQPPLKGDVIRSRGGGKKCCEGLVWMTDGGGLDSWGGDSSLLVTLQRQGGTATLRRLSSSPVLLQSTSLEGGGDLLDVGSLTFANLPVRLSVLVLDCLAA